MSDHAPCAGVVGEVLGGGRGDRRHFGFEPEPPIAAG